MNERSLKYSEALIGCSVKLYKKRVRTVHLHDNLGVTKKRLIGVNERPTRYVFFGTTSFRHDAGNRYTRRRFPFPHTTRHFHHARYLVQQREQTSFF